MRRHSAEPSVRITDFLLANGATALISGDQGLIRMIIGCEVSDGIELSPPFAPPVLVLTRDREPLLGCGGRDIRTAWAEVVPYEYPTAVPAFARVSAVADLFSRRKLDGRVMVDAATVPADIASLVSSPEFAPPAVRMLTAVKPPWDIAAIAESARCCDEGQRAARAASAAGATETEMTAAARSSIDEAAEGPTLTLSEMRTITTDESRTTLCDLAPRVRGMWADSASSWSDSLLSNKYAQTHATVRKALDLAKSLIRPGSKACEVDRRVRGFLEREGFIYPHHTGHGVGYALFEQPVIAPAAEVVIEEGMTIALEPAAYTRDFAIRLEQLVVVRVDGVEVLSSHPLEAGLR